MAEALGRYRLDKPLGRGGMGEVFLARQSGPGGYERLCVVKRLLERGGADSDFVQMFLDEARVAAQLIHPHIGQIYDFGEVDGVYYLAMEYVDGAPLHRVLGWYEAAGQRLPIGVATSITAQIARALEYMRTARGADGQVLDVIHRDISPQNILIARTGLAKLIDFGVAKARRRLQETVDGSVKGKYIYMSPEHVQGLPIDHRTDIYSLGLVFYELLSGRRAIGGDNDVSEMRAAMNAAFPPVETLRPDVPDALAQALRRALAPQVERRYATAGELAAALEAYLSAPGNRVTDADVAHVFALEGPVTPPPPGTTVPVGPRAAAAADDASTRLSEGARRRRLAPWFGLGGGFIATVAVGVAAWLVWGALRPTPPLPEEAGGADRTGGQRDEPGTRDTPDPPQPAGPVATGGEPADRQPAVGERPGGEADGALRPGQAQGSARAPGEPEPGVPPAVPRPVDSTPPRKSPAPAARGPKTTAPPPPRETPAPALPPAAPGRGYVAFRVFPYAEVFLGPKSLGITPLEPVALDPGPHTFRLVWPEGPSETVRDVVVEPNKTTMVRVDFRVKTGP